MTVDEAIMAGLMEKPAEPSLSMSLSLSLPGLGLGLDSLSAPGRAEPEPKQSEEDESDLTRLPSELLFYSADHDQVSPHHLHTSCPSSSSVYR